MMLMATVKVRLNKLSDDWQVAKAVFEDKCKAFGKDVKLKSIRSSSSTQDGFEAHLLDVHRKYCEACPTVGGRRSVGADRDGPAAGSAAELYVLEQKNYVSTSSQTNLPYSIYGLEMNALDSQNDDAVNDKDNVNNATSGPLSVTCHLEDGECAQADVIRCPNNPSNERVTSTKSVKEEVFTDDVHVLTEMLPDQGINEENHGKEIIGEKEKDKEQREDNAKEDSEEDHGRPSSLEDYDTKKLLADVTSFLERTNQVLGLTIKEDSQDHCDVNIASSRHEATSCQGHEENPTSASDVTSQCSDLVSDQPIEHESDSRDVDMVSGNNEPPPQQRIEEEITSQLMELDGQSHLDRTDQVKALHTKHENASQNKDKDSSRNEATSHQRVEEEIASQHIGSDGKNFLEDTMQPSSSSHKSDVHSHEGNSQDLCHAGIGSKRKVMNTSGSNGEKSIQITDCNKRYSHTCHKQYQCCVCAKGFTKMSLITRHMRAHTGEKPLKCDKCSYRCAKKGNRRCHMRLRTGEKPFKCDKCSYRCAKKGDFRCHMRIHTGEKPFKCDKCSYRSAGKGNLKCHMRIHTGEKPFKCDKCSYRCARKGNLQCHVRMHTGEKPFKCDKCSYRCARKGNLKRHIGRIHTGEKRFKCHNCSYRCAEKRSLKHHMRIHKGEKPFKCDSCSYRCSEKQYLQRHIRRAHTDEKPFKCVKCSYRCSEKQSLQRHIIRIHRGEKPFKCDSCNYRCSEKQDLKRHFRWIHTEEKPFKCDNCSYRCAEKGNLKRHMKIHTGEKPFKCDNCSNRFADKGNLKRHMRRIHTEKPFKCDKCSYTCSQKASLQVHMRKHTGEKPFKCDHCSYRCAVKGYLQMHMRKHT